MTDGAAGTAEYDLTIVVPALNQASNLEFLLPALTAAVAELGIRAEVVVVDGGSTDRTAESARDRGAHVLTPPSDEYGVALLAGFAGAARAPFVATLDADISDPGSVLRDLWAARDGADLVVASRYVAGGASRTPWLRRVPSRLLNALCSHVLSVPVGDLTSGCRLYRRRILESLQVTSRDFAVLPEILVRLFAEGYRVVEVPFRFTPRGTGRPRGRHIRLAWSYVRTSLRLWHLRNSILSADYDHRAFDSIIPLQRYWQRARHRIVLDFTGRAGRILDVGCGSSRILRDLPGAIGADVLLRKLRFLRAVHPEVVQASVFALPFADAAFDTVICSEVIEHIPDDPEVLGELTRVLAAGGTLVVGTPDYGRWLWHAIEWVYGRVAPGAYAHEHITHFDRAGLQARLRSLGYELLDCRYVGACEMIIKARKPSGRHR